jgi:hypothetical protein
MTPKVTAAQVKRFREIIGEIKELMDEAKGIIRDGPRITYERAKAYPLGHIYSSLDGDSEYLGENCTLDAIADELEDAVTPCKKCGSPLDEDQFCTDETCPFHEISQDDEPDTEPKLS